MIIGISQRILLHKNFAYDSIEHNWYKYLKNHDIIPIPNISNQDFSVLSDTLDILILSGGDDSTLRRATELKIATEMMKRQKPIIGECHGAFLLTDILGGQVAEITGHSNIEHQVNYFGEIKTVNSFHNLGIKTPHKQAVILANDDEGNCEAWIDNKIAGVVWHPERMSSAWMPEEIECLLAK